MTTLRLSPAQRAQIEAEARTALPRECCGLIEGIRRDDTLEVLTLHPARNLAAGADRFEIDPADHIKAQRAARARGRAIVGCYHSHPGGEPQPSPHDRAGASETSFVWLIAAVAAQGAVRLAAYSFGGNAFTPVSLAENPLA